MMRAALMAFLALFMGAAVAQQTAANRSAELQAPGARSAASLGRLFYTPAQRAALDVARRARPVPLAAQAEAPPLPPPPQVVSYGGIVRRSDGKAMLWINNRLVEEKEALKGLNLKGRVRPDGAVTLQVPDSGGSLEVKVGQSVEVHTGKVAETRKRTEEEPREPAKGAGTDGKSEAPDGAPAPATKGALDAPQSRAPAGAASDAARAPGAPKAAAVTPGPEPRAAGR
jgi:hypothetical protein